ncbi:MAG TPA: 3-hydroxyacyl-CoA dehydrogenase NAD-binding domain-containing protein [Candidatus Methylomirabilis sp.]|nr:3-hydroxyacyl-CoA dehydrogenase NAD-binding domain-containing protein [Candidatus Methylomirabilis sp.]HSD50232.1 3-hydroxyacyl-CoA dehydrogenase NAD-binding domain-containing protein [Candidatus Methylomirabilis sp.]
MDIRHVAVAGTGMMGPGIAATFALVGCRATIVSRTAEGAAGGVAKARSLIETLSANGLADAGQAKDAVTRLAPSTDPEAAVRAAQLFVESIPEDLPAKQAFFARLDKVSPDVILCSNTSGISITAIASKSTRRQRILTTHFWNPPHLMPLVEVAVSEWTTPQIAEEVMRLLRTCGKLPVLVRKDRPGQLGNRIQHAMIRECVNIVQEGIATAEDVDLAVKTGVGLRLPVYGVFEHADMVGLDLVKAVQDYVLPDLSTVPHAGELHQEKVAKGDLGVKTGRGFLEWTPAKAQEIRARRDAFLIQFLRWQKAGTFS